MTELVSRKEPGRGQPQAGAILQLITPPDAAEFLRLSTSTLAKMRLTGRGPRYRKHGRRVVYDRIELENWSSRGERASTSELSSDHGALQ